MNDISRITDKIALEAKTYAVAANEQAKQDVKLIGEKYMSECEYIKASYAQRAKKSIAEKNTRCDSTAKLNRRIALLRTKNELIDEAFAVARTRIAALGSEKKAAFYASLAESALRNEQNGVITLCEADTADSGVILCAINAKAAALGYPPVMLSEKTVAAGCGFTVSYGDLEYNCLIDTLIDSRRSELEALCAGILF